MNKLSIKTSMSSRDKQLLLTLLLIVLAFICYYFVINPQIDKSFTLKKDFDSLKAQIEESQILIDNINNLRAEENKKKEELLKKYKIFFYELKDERLLYTFDNMLNAAGLPSSAYSTDGLSAAPIYIERGNYKSISFPLMDLASKSNPLLKEGDKEKQSNNEPPNETTDKPTADSVASKELKIQFNGGTYGNIVSFLASVEKMNKAIILKSLNIIRSSDTQALNGEIVLGLYSLPKVDDQEASYLEFKPVIPKGKQDPFQ